MKVVSVYINNFFTPFFCDPQDVEIYVGNIYIIETTFGLDSAKVIKGPFEITTKSKNEEIGKIIRIANQDDFKKIEKLKKDDIEALKIAREKLVKHKLPIKIFSAHNMFDEKRILFFFTSEKRVDFRKYVRDLAAVFKKRIELRQVPFRMETKLLGGIGICGKEFCCTQFLREVKEKASLKMAKEQNLSLSDTKVIGVCNKPMCCLAYESETYNMLLKEFPEQNTKVKFNINDIKEKLPPFFPLSGEVTGKVKGFNVLKNTVYVELDKVQTTIEVNLSKIKK